jgi:hypothetical protein
MNSNPNAEQATQQARVMLAYVYYPVTTAVYFERALRQNHQVVSIGPKMDEGLIQAWNLQAMHLPIKDQQIPTEYEPDLAALFRRLPQAMHPDLYLWVESVSGHFPRNLESVPVPKACYLIDSHLNLAWHVQWARQFDHVFIAQREYLPAFREAGCTSVHWLPLGADPEIHRGVKGDKLYDLGFVGSLNTERRVRLLNALERQVRVTYQRCFWTDMADFFAQSRIVFNNAIKNDLNMRLFEVMSTGTFLLTDNALNSGQDEMFKGNEDLGQYTDETLVEMARYYLDHADERERIAARGQRLIHRAHLYAHRLDDLLQVAIGGKPGTYSAAELRERSLAGEPARPPVSRPLVVESTPPQTSGRSFVIPVLDMSPASPYNIMTLLDDMRTIAGDVIVVCNSPAMAEQLKGHPRVDYMAAMSHNVGVARAWNIGLAMSQTPVTFFLNADLHVTGDVFATLERALHDLPDAAVVGPQGSFFDFATAQDIQYFQRGSFSAPINVDAVSGFLFGVRTNMFGPGGIQFENAFTPCYFEEWDLGLQCRLMGVKCYIVPTAGYEHEWSGSIRALRTIKYFRSEATSREILDRNRAVFLEKWKRISRSMGSHGFLDSLWTEYNATQQAPRAPQVAG